MTLTKLIRKTKRLKRRVVIKNFITKITQIFKRHKKKQPSIMDSYYTYKYNYYK